MPATIPLLDILGKFCCCKGSATADREGLLNSGGYNEETYNIPNGSSSATYASSSRTALSDRNLQSQTRSREEEEEDLMNKILDRTQQSIIDVTNLENNSLDIDMLQRSRFYAEAVKRHDLLTERRTGLTAASDQELAAQPSLLTNMSTRAPELLANPSVIACTREELDLLNRVSDHFLDAHRSGTQIECKEELIVYMSLDD